MSKEVNNKNVYTSSFDLAVQILALVTFFVLLIFDKGIGATQKDISDMMYGIIGAFGVGGIDLLKAIVNKGKK